MIRGLVDDPGFLDDPGVGGVGFPGVYSTSLTCVRYTQRLTHLPSASASADLCPHANSSTPPWNSENFRLNSFIHFVKERWPGSGDILCLIDFCIMESPALLESFVEYFSQKSNSRLKRQ